MLSVSGRLSRYSPWDSSRRASLGHQRTPGAGEADRWCIACVPARSPAAPCSCSFLPSAARPWLRRVSSDTSATFADVDGDGVDDACQEAALENTEAAAAAFDAADLNDDGEISVTEAAQSGWTGGTNCNHGGYVSQVAQADESKDRRESRWTPTRPKRRPARKSWPLSLRPARPDGSQQPRRLGGMGRGLRGGRWQELQSRRCRERGRQEGPGSRQGRTGSRQAERDARKPSAKLHATSRSRSAWTARAAKGHGKPN